MIQICLKLSKDVRVISIGLNEGGDGSGIHDETMRMPACSTKQQGHCAGPAIHRRAQKIQANLGLLASLPPTSCSL